MSQSTGASATPLQATEATLQPTAASAAPWEMLLRRSPAASIQHDEAALQNQDEGPERTSERQIQDQMHSPPANTAQLLKEKFSIFSPSRHRPASASAQPTAAPAGAATQADANTAQPATRAPRQPQEWLSDLDELLPDGEAGHKQGNPSVPTPKANQRSTTRGTAADALPQLSASAAAKVVAPSLTQSAELLQSSSQPLKINRSTLCASSTHSNIDTNRDAETEQPKPTACRADGEGQDRESSFEQRCLMLQKEVTLLKARCAELEAAAAKDGAAAQLRAREMDELARRCKDLREQLRDRGAAEQLACSEAEALKERCSDLERREAAQASALDALSHESTASKARCEDLEARLAQGDTRLDKALQELHRAELWRQELQAQASVVRRSPLFFSHPLNFSCSIPYRDRAVQMLLHVMYGVRVVRTMDLVQVPNCR